MVISTKPQTTAAIEILKDREAIEGYVSIKDLTQSFNEKQKKSSINFENIPQELKSIRRWVLWEGKKIPCQGNGSLASATNPNTWDTFENVKSYYEVRGYSGIGFVLTDEDDIVCIDLDNKLEEYKTFAQEFGSYAEVSPSGNGIHIWCRGKKPGGKCRRGDIEIYEDKRYITFTGHHIEGTPCTLENCQEGINELYEQIANPTAGSDNEMVQLKEPPEDTHLHKKSSRQWDDNQKPSAGGSSLTDEEIISLGRVEKDGKFSSLYNGSIEDYPSHSEADAALCCKIAFYTKDASQIESIFRSSGLFRADGGRHGDYDDCIRRTVQSALSTVTGQYEPPKPKSKKQSQKEEIESKILDEELELKDKALEVIKSGNVLELFRKTFATLYTGNVPILDVILLAFSAASAKTTKGIHPGFSGNKGEGKTSGCVAALHILPQEYVYAGSMSPKAVFYSDIPSGSIVFRDDTYLEDEILQTFKTAMSSFQGGLNYTTVMKGSAMPLTLNQRIIFIFTSVHDTGDDELADRQFKISLSSNDEQKINRINDLADRMAEGREALPLTHDVLLCRQIMQIIKSKLFYVTVPYARRIDFLNINNMRDIEQFYDFIQATAILNYMNRNPVVDGENIRIDANEDDFDTALEIFSTTDDIRDYKVSANEHKLYIVIEKSATGLIGGQPHKRYITETALHDACRENGWNLNKQTMRHYLYGRKEKSGSQNNILGGLCYKLPNISVEQESLGSSSKVEGESKTTSSHENVNYIVIDTSQKISSGQIARLNPL